MSKLKPYPRRACTECLAKAAKKAGIKFDPCMCITVTVGYCSVCDRSPTSSDPGSVGWLSTTTPGDFGWPPLEGYEDPPGQTGVIIWD